MTNDSRRHAAPLDARACMCVFLHPPAARALKALRALAPVAWDSRSTARPVVPRRAVPHTDGDACGDVGPTGLCGL